MSGTWKIGFADAQKRLDVFLTEKVAGLSRAQAKKQVEAGDFTVNKKSVSGHHFLKEGDVVAATVGPSTRLIALKEKRITATEGRPTAPAPKLQIIKETPDWIVVYKPIDVLMHPDHDHTDGTLIDAVIQHAPQVAKVGEDPGRPGIVSRLDKDVSGLVVIAKTEAAFESLKKQFADHTVTKAYNALVHGEIPTDEGELKFRIARSSTKARMAARPATSEGGQAAWTHYEVLERYVGATLLKLEILTGRTHQIRAHLHAFGHPVIGDPLYKRRLPDRNVDAPRVFLQSVFLAFNDPTSGERMTFELPLDPEFAAMKKILTTSK